MINFRKWLKEKGYLTNTIRGYINNMNCFINWCESNQIKPDVATLNQIYEYVEHIRNKGYGIICLKGRILALKHYYKFIRRKTNPALLVKVEKAEKKLPSNLLDEETLTSLFISIIPQTLGQKKSKVMLGLVIFQAVKREELELLELEHVDIENKRIYIPSSSRCNSRYVHLEMFQIKDIERYIYQLRPQLLKEAKKNTSKLFFSSGQGKHLNNSLTFIMKGIKRINPYLKTLAQLRESRITIWLKKYGVRQAQYLSGLRYPTSLSRYKKTDIDNLKNKLKLVHPMERLGI